MRIYLPVIGLKIISSEFVEDNINNDNNDNNRSWSCYVDRLETVLRYLMFQNCRVCLL